MEIHPDIRRDWPRYALSLAIILALGLLMAFLVWRGTRTPPSNSDAGPPGFGPGWDCTRVPDSDPVCGPAAHASTSHNAPAARR